MCVYCLCICVKDVMITDKEARTVIPIVADPDPGSGSFFTPGF